MDAELTQFFIDQFAKLATREDVAELRSEMSEMRSELNSELSSIRSEMATKGELAEVKKEVSEIKVIVQRLDKRTDEDIRATMKDVEKIKIHLSEQGIKI